MDIQYKKDLRHSYMVIGLEDNKSVEAYSMKMIEKQHIEGILTIEHRIVDNKPLLYYDITAKQSLEIILDKEVLTYDKVKRFCETLISTVERAYEYLLPEDDFILKPEFIYMEVFTNKTVLCYLPGYNKPLKEQMSSLLEYLMNKVDYNDRDAVVLVYQLYSVSKEDGFTFDHLLNVVQQQNKLNYDNDYKPDIKRQRNYISKENIADVRANNTDINKSESVIKDYKLNRRDEENCFSKPEAEKRTDIASRIPVMLEKLEGEQEVPYYPWKTYLYSGICIGIGILIIVFCFVFKIIYNSFGTRIDYTKLFAMGLIILGIEGYFFKLIWDKKNMLTKIIPKNEYIDPRQELPENYQREYKQRQSMIEELMPKEEGDSIVRQNEPGDIKIRGNRPSYKQVKTASDRHSEADNHHTSILLNDEQEDNPTCLLNAAYDVQLGNITANQEKTLILEPLDKTLYQSILIKNIPFFIGKLKKNVDYFLENELVSRYHAKITKENDNYFITDLNSTNGTFVNGAPLQTYEKRNINIGDEVAFANIRYKFMETGNEANN